MAEDYEKTYADFWKDIVEHPDGTLNRDQIMRELHDFHALLDEVPKVYCEVTGGRFSKPNTAAHHVIGEVEERTQEAIREARQEIVEGLRADAAAHRRLVARMPTEHDEARLARATCLDDAAARIARGEGR